MENISAEVPAAAGDHPGDPSDADVVRTVLAGDAAAFAYLVRRYKDVLYRYAELLTGRPDDAADVVQQAFIKVWGDRVATHPIEMTRAVEQSGRFLSSIYEIDYRDMTRETWRRARASFDQAYTEFRTHLGTAWDQLEDAS